MQRGFPGLKPADATHLASAAMTNAEEMHTFDVRLLSFDGNIVRADGTNLKICKPSMGGAPVPLLEGGATTDDDFAEEEPSEEQASATVRASGEGAGVPEDEEAFETALRQIAQAGPVPKHQPKKRSKS
jgi:hypothetical protein